MYVIIAGASKLSYRLVQTLLQGGHEVTLIEKDRAKSGPPGARVRAVGAAG